MSTDSKARPATSVVTDEGRFSFVTIFEARRMPGAEKAKFSLQFLWPKTNTAFTKRLHTAIEADKEAGKTSSKTKWNGKFPPLLKLPIRDGDVEKPDRPEYAGMWFINANNNNKPGIVDKALNPIINATEVYSGCYGRISINFFAFGGLQNGVGCGLNNVQKLRDGEPLSGGASAEFDFGGEDNDDGL
jgi:hypothetical protein